MDLPIPKKNEKQTDFMPRCLDIISAEFPDPKERVKVAYSQWKNPTKKDSNSNPKRSFVFNLDYSKKSDFRVDETTGFLHAKARVTRSGVFDYYTEDGDLIREYRSPEEVFDEKSIQSLKLKPITDDHPEEMVTVDNIKDFQIGTVGEDIQKDGDFLTTNIIITDKEMVTTIVNRKKANLPIELSLGYNCDVLPDMGIHDTDGWYTHSQRKIKYNHLSIVDKARAGRDVRILDKLNKNKKESKMADKVQFTRKSVNLDSFKIDAITKVVDEDSLELANTLSSKLDEAVDVIVGLNKDKDALQGKFDQSNETITSLKAKVDSLSDINSPKISAMIKSRNDVENIAKMLKVDCDGKDIKTIKCDCVIAVSKDADMKDKTDEYINARFDSVMELVNEEKKDEGNQKFSNFMQKLDGERGKDQKNHRDAFLDKDKEQNRKRN